MSSSGGLGKHTDRRLRRCVRAREFRETLPVGVIAFGLARWCAAWLVSVPIKCGGALDWRM